MKYAALYITLFLLGIMVGHSYKKPATIKVISSPVEMVVEEDCFMDNGGERLQMKRLTIEDLEKQDGMGN